MLVRIYESNAPKWCKMKKEDIIYTIIGFVVISLVVFGIANSQAVEEKVVGNMTKYLQDGTTKYLITFTDGNTTTISFTSCKNLKVGDLVNVTVDKTLHRVENIWCR